MSDPSQPNPPVPTVDSYEQPHDQQPAIERVHGAIYREAQDPVDGREPVSIWLIVAMLTLALGMGWYMGTYDGNFSAAVYDGPEAADAAAVAAGGSVQTVAIDPVLLGKRVYANCMSCHQPTGLGLPGQYPPLAGSEWVNGDERVLARILLKGLQGPVQVAGATYNAEMPTWKQLKDRDIAAVLTYIRQEWGNSSSPVSEALVADIRKQTAGRATAWTAPELAAVAASLPTTAPSTGPATPPVNGGTR